MSTDKVQALLQEVREHREELFPIVAHLRDVILAAGPSITEEVKYGGLLFSSGQSFCGVFPYKAHVTLEFSQGAALADPHGFLSGDGKYRRHIKLETVQDIETRRVAEYVASARAAADS
ncbi:DUF1801 domain-containing protein [Pararhizobium sp. DWP1-1-3]|uniref:DUF1801 domain-containing protein n=1 Tax=Pararhizobium sp. DWP1-1-3 TaxID=2804652 RepID=UPI003CF536BA